jgi:hypothetical protein
VANSVALTLAVDVPLGVKIYGLEIVPAPAQVPPVVVAVPTVILTCPDPKIGVASFDLVSAAFGKWMLEKEEIENDKNKIKR